jgi:hypothetical protein
MRKLFTLLFISIFTISLNAQQTQANLNYLKSAKKKVRTGTTLLIVGGGTVIAGAVLYVNGLSTVASDSYSSSSTYYSDTSTDGLGAALGGLVCIIAGAVVMEVGIPFMIVGGIQKGRANRRLQMTMVNFKTPYSQASINGVGFKLKF